MQDAQTQIAFLITAGTILFLLLACFIVFSLYAYQRKHHQYVKEKKEIQNKYEQEILKTQLEIQEQTLQTISQEIHDNLGQILSLIKLNLHTMDVQTGSVTEQKLLDSRELLSQAITDLRSISKSLNTDLITRSGLTSLLQHTLERIQRTGMFQTTLQVAGFEKTLDPQKTLVLFRIVQEILNNAIKHANASRIDVELAFSPSDVTLSITDNGIGFNTHTNTTTHTGNGLGNMYNRARLIGATLHLESQAEQGTQVRIHLPF